MELRAHIAKTKVLLLAGGLGTRLSEETSLKPKPMVEIGGKPMLWHIMKLYSSFGFNQFVVALGYKGEVIKDYFLNYTKRVSDLSIDLSSGNVTISDKRSEPWSIELVDTGLETHTGGRVKKICERMGPGIFMMTYGDGVANVDIKKLLAFHLSHGKLATVTAVRPPARFGALSFNGDEISMFQEKPNTGEGWINGGFFVLDTRVAEYIATDDTPFETEPLRTLAQDGELAGFKHDGFWHCMDTLRDVKALEEMWSADVAPWKLWNDQIAKKRNGDETEILETKKGTHHRPHRV